MSRFAKVLVALTLAGCASAARIERSADNHQARARELAEAGDMVGASKEHAAAEKQRSKANERRAYEHTLPVVYH